MRLPASSALHSMQRPEQWVASGLFLPEARRVARPQLPARAGQKTLDSSLRAFQL